MDVALLEPRDVSPQRTIKALMLGASAVLPSLSPVVSRTHAHTHTTHASAPASDARVAEPRLSWVSVDAEKKKKKAKSFWSVCAVQIRCLQVAPLPPHELPAGLF